MQENRVLQTEPLISSYLNRKACGLGLPVGGSFELTARCNFNCKMCYVHLSESEQARLGRELTADEWLSLASDARDMGLIFLLLTGGEPFLRGDFVCIYEQLVKMGLVISVNTNAYLYNSELRKLFKKYPPSRLNVTLYGGSDETYERLCGRALFGRVKQNLRSMCADGLPVRLNVSLTPQNAGDMEAIDAISRELKLQAKAASYMYPPVRLGGAAGENAARFSAEQAGRAMARWNMLRDTREAFIERARRIREHQAGGISENCAHPEQEGVSCRAGRSSFWLTWDGRMTPCGTMDIQPSFPLRDGFASAWEEVRARTAAIRLPSECAACKMRKNCGVCAAVCKCETGRFDGKPEYLCAMSKSLAECVLETADKMQS